MMAVVSSQGSQDFAQLRKEFEAFGETLNVKINIQSSAILTLCITCKNRSSSLMDIKQVTETIAMIEEQNFDVRTITMGISLLDCIDSNIEKAAEKVYHKIITKAGKLVQVGMIFQQNSVFQLLISVYRLHRFQLLVQQQMRRIMCP